uniref:(northern house mosquito) hypothetical protein n=1 Tax=Culex pipiens TaxID=7175 RepID=A0A8D8MXQ1_CULPI
MSSMTVVRMVCVTGSVANWTQSTSPPSLRSTRKSCFGVLGSNPLSIMSNSTPPWNKFWASPVATLVLSSENPLRLGLTASRWHAASVTSFRTNSQADRFSDSTH